MVFGLVVLAGGCGDSADSTTTSSGTGSTAATLQSTTTTAGPAIVFTAELNGANVVPPVTTNAKGTLTLTVQPDGLRVDYVITIKKLTNLTVARLREGKPGASTGVLITLYDGPTKSGAFTGVLAEGSFTAKDLGGSLKGKTIADLVTLIENGEVFLNVGNSSHKSGAICGQLTSTSATETTVTAPSSTTTATQPGTSGGGTQGTQSLADLFATYQQATSLSLDFTVTTPDGQTSSGSMWERAGRLLKIQTTTGGVESVMIIDLVKNTMTVYQPSTKQGMQTTVNVPFEDPAAYAAGVDVGNMQDLGTEVVDGETCRVTQYSTTSTDGLTTVKMWLSERLGFPVKVTGTTADGKTTTITYSNIKIGELPGDTFEVPADVKITTAP